MLCLGLLEKLGIYNGSALVPRARDTDEVRPTLSRAGPPAANCLHLYRPTDVMHPGKGYPRICCVPTPQPSPGVLLTPSLMQGVLRVKGYMWHRLTPVTAAAPTLCGGHDVRRAVFLLTKWQFQVGVPQSHCGMCVDSWVPNAGRCTGDSRASSPYEPSHPPASVKLARSQEPYLQRS